MADRGKALVRFQTEEARASAELSEVGGGLCHKVCGT